MNTLEKLIAENGGIENFRCFAQMGKIEIATPFGFCLTSDKCTWTECRIDESRYKISDEYKITLRSLDPAFTYEHYYQSDFMSLVECGLIIIKSSQNQKIEHVIWAEPFYNDICIIHEADIVR